MSYGKPASIQSSPSLESLPPNHSKPGITADEVTLKMSLLFVPGCLGFFALIISLDPELSADIIGNSTQSWVRYSIGISGTLLFLFCASIVFRLESSRQKHFSTLFETEPQSLLAHWIIPEEIWSEFVRDEQERAEKNLLIYAWIGGVFVTIVGWAEYGLLAGLVGASVAVIWTIVEAYRWRRNRATNAEVWIRPDGMRINNKVINWSDFGARLDSVKWDREAGGEVYDVFEVNKSAPSKHGRIHNEHRIALPVDQRERMEYVIEVLESSVIEKCLP